jgi:hypothetical protein
MKDQYVGDIGDFGKYGLLRALCGGPGMQPSSDLLPSLGIVWYQTPYDKDSKHGEHTGYLTASARNLRGFRACDPHLYDQVARVVRSGERSVRSIMQSGIFSGGTRFFREEVPEAADREVWCDAACDEVRGCQVIFLDPDNGLEPQGRYSRKASNRYVLPWEVERFGLLDATLVIYQHSGRTKGCTVGVQAARWSRRLRDVLPHREMLAVGYHRGASRTFLILPARGCEQGLKETVGRFLDGPWGICRHFSWIIR